MKVCIIGDGLVSLTLANVLIQKDIFVDIYRTKKFNLYDQSRTLGISKSNIDYFNNEVLDIRKILWKINTIKIYTEKDSKKELLKFDNKKKQIFSIIRNYQLQKLLVKNLKKNKFIRFRDNLKIEKNKYKLVKSINNNIRSSVRKLNPILKGIVGKKVDVAIRDLQFSEKRITRDIRKTINSAVANAENNFQYDIDKLIVKEAYCGKKIIMKRFRPRAKGRAAPILKPYSSVTIILSEIKKVESHGTKS